MGYRLIIMAAALLSLPACQTSPAALTGAALDASVPVKPAQIADRVTLDERVGVVATVGYTAASRLGAALARAGLIDKAQFKELDQRGFEAVQKVRQAYLAGNARTYTEAIDRVNGIVGDINTLVK